MKNFENIIDSNGSSEPKTVRVIIQDVVLQNNNNRKTTLEMMFDSCHDYSSRVWNVVKADLQEDIDKANGMSSK